MSAEPHRYWLGLGANLGAPRVAMAALLGALRRHGVLVERVSGLYETAPQEVSDQPPFLNAAVEVSTPSDPEALLALVKRLERQLGRVAGPRYGPRRVDCDILAWSGGRHRSAELEIPHPRLVSRRFALVPLVEIAPELRLPDGSSAADALAELDPDDQPVRPLGRGLD